MYSNGNYKEEGYSIKIHEGWEHPDGVEYVVDVFDKNGDEAGYFKFNHWFNHPQHGEILQHPQKKAPCFSYGNEFLFICIKKPYIL